MARERCQESGLRPGQLFTRLLGDFHFPNTDEFQASRAAWGWKHMGHLLAAFQLGKVI